MMTNDLDGRLYELSEELTKAENRARLKDDESRLEFLGHLRKKYQITEGDMVNSEGCERKQANKEEAAEAVYRQLKHICDQYWIADKCGGRFEIYRHIDSAERAVQAYEEANDTTFKSAFK